MSKTAEEICRSRVEPNDLPDYQVLVLQDAIKCAHEFAAQEVEEYKKRLNERCDTLLDGPASNLTVAAVEIFKAIINTVK